MRCAGGSMMQAGADPTGEILVLNLIAPPEVAEALAEWLLERDDVPGFTSVPVSGHGSSEHSMTLGEQVAGRSRRVLFFTHLPDHTVDDLLRSLSEAFPGSGLHYWVTPVRAAGNLG